MRELNCPISDEATLSLLRWYRAVGVDWWVQAEACRWVELNEGVFGINKPRPARTISSQTFEGPLSRPAENSRPKLSALTTDNKTLVDEASSLAASAVNLAELRQHLQAFEGSPLKYTARSLVFSDGLDTADLMIIGLYPNRDDDRAGKPLSGPAGALIDKILIAVGLTRADVYMTHILPWRPPGNRPPTQMEIALFKPFIHRHIALIQPKYLLFLGEEAGASLCTKANDEKPDHQISAMAYHADGSSIPALWTHHPDTLLRQKHKKAESWRHWLSLKKIFQGCRNEPK